MLHWASLSSVGKIGAGDPGLIPGLGRSSGEGNGNPLQYSCLENSMDRGAWWATVYEVTRVRHNWATSHIHILLLRIKLFWFLVLLMACLEGIQTGRAEILLVHWRAHPILVFRNLKKPSLMPDHFKLGLGYRLLQSSILILFLLSFLSNFYN